jgi:16S rRNA G966 N2-methylase RsmD
LFVYFLGVLGSLDAKFGAVFSDPPQPKEIVRAVANANLWIPTRSAFSSG